MLSSTLIFRCKELGYGQEESVEAVAGTQRVSSVPYKSRGIASFLH